jgi:predicted phage terminase large subunit-like protein
MTAQEHEWPWWHKLNYIEAGIFYAEYVASAKSAADEKEMKRQLVLNDLWYLLTVACDMNFMLTAPHNTQWLYERCREVEHYPDGYLDLWAREHFKSTVITFGLTIQDILKDPEVTFGIFSFSKDNATVFTKQIKEQLENNVELQFLFPDVLYNKPGSHSPEWTESSFIVKRKGRPKEPTVMACGLLKGMPTGMHFQKRVYDDIITEDMVGTPDMIRKTTDRFRNSTNLGKLGGVMRGVGTRYHQFDSYHHVLKAGSLLPRVHAATADGTDDTRLSVFLPPEALEKKRKDQGPYIFGCQQLQNPQADNLMGFNQEWLQYWDADVLDNLNFWIICDPSSGKRGTTGKNKNDYTCFWVIGRGGDGNYYVCDIIRARLNLTNRADVLIKLHRKYSQRGEVRVGYEEYGMQADIEHIKYVQTLQNYRFKITPLGGGMNKNARINRLHPLFEQGRIFLPHRCIKQITEGGQTRSVDMVRTFIEDEYAPYPVLDHDDMLDALSRIEDEDMKKLSAPSPVSSGYNALREIELMELEQEPVV